jgi:DNA-binding SARP family transcriptional activator
MLVCRLLGPVEMWSDGQQIKLRYPRQRGLLVMLLAEVNRLVSAESLIDRIWGENPPQKARDILYADISRLRHALDGAAEIRLTRKSGGYLIEADPLAVDLHRFRELVARSRTSQRDEERAALLEEALALWQGEPFADLGNSWLTSLRVSLVQERLDALLDRNDALLRLGRHTTLLSELSALSAAHPLDERVAAQYMLALYRSGRQADALYQYRLTRKQLDDDVGVEPGPELRDLYQSILRSAPELNVPAASHVATRPPMPRQLPARIPRLVGRVNELRQVTRLLEDATTSPAFVITGTAGIGKTALAVHWAHQVADQFPDGQLYVNLRGFEPSGAAMPPTEAIHRFVEALGVSAEAMPADLDARAALYRSLLAERRVLVVLDNVRDADQVRPLLPGSATCAVVITSRNQLESLVASEGAYPVTLRPFSAEEGIALVASRLGTDYVTSHRQAADELVQRCARLPLALTIAAARASIDPHLPLTTLVEQLRDEQTRLDVLDTGDPASSVRAAFSWSYRHLGQQASRMFRMLGIHPGPDISLPAAASLAGVGRDDARAALATLKRACLVSEPAPGRFVLHDLLSLYAAERAKDEETPADRGTATRRLLDWYLHSADAADRLLVPRSQRVPLGAPDHRSRPLSFNGRQEALEWCDAERSNFVAVTRLAADTGHDDTAWKLPIALWGYFTLCKPWSDWMTTHHIGLTAAERSDDRLGQAHIRTALANAHRDIRRFDDAVRGFREALPIWREIGNRWGEAAALTLLGMTYRDSADFHAALDCLHEALDIFGGIDDRWGEAWALYNLGEAHQQLASPQQAVVYSERAMASFREVGDRWGEGWALYNLGKIHQKLGDLPAAASSLRHALNVFGDIGNRMGEGVALAALGTLLMRTDRAHEARDCLRQALSIFEDLGAPQAADLRARLKDV